MRGFRHRDSARNALQDGQVSGSAPASARTHGWSQERNRAYLADFAPFYRFSRKTARCTPLRATQMPSGKPSYPLFQAKTWRTRWPDCDRLTRYAVAPNCPGLPEPLAPPHTAPRAGQQSTAEPLSDPQCAAYTSRVLRAPCQVRQCRRRLCGGSPAHQTPQAKRAQRVAIRL